MKLFPKTDGYTQMVLTFVSRSFGVGLFFSDDEMREVNKRRTSRDWDTYLSTKEAIEICGIDRKKNIKG